jgi:hypothetical protein
MHNKKWCSDCKKTKPLADFYKAARGKKGVERCCKRCHYQRTKNYRKARKSAKPLPAVPDGMVRCRKCKKIKSIGEFYRNRRRKSGLSARCGSCDLAAVLSWQAKNPKKARTSLKRAYAKWSNKPEVRTRLVRYERARRYGLTVDQLLAIENKACGKCAICKRALRLHIDHDHATGRVRGLLCSNCNLGIGLFGEDVQRMRQAIHYLRERANSAEAHQKTKVLSCPFSR